MIAENAEMKPLLTLADVSPRDKVYKVVISCIDKVEDIPLKYKQAMMTFFYWQDGPNSRKFKRYVGDFGLSESDVEDHKDLVWHEIHPAGIWDEFEQILNQQETSKQAISPVIREMYDGGMKSIEIVNALAPLGVKGDTVYKELQHRKQG